MPKKSTKPTVEITDDEILKMDKVTPAVVAKYLGMPYAQLTWLLQEGQLPFGKALKKGKWNYYIDSKKLVDYKNGRSDISILLRMINELQKSADENQKTVNELKNMAECYIRKLGETSV